MTSWKEEESQDFNREFDVAVRAGVRSTSEDLRVRVLLRARPVQAVFSVFCLLYVYVYYV